MRKLAAVAVSIGVILVIAGLVMVGIFGGDAIKDFSIQDILNGTNHKLENANASKDREAEQLQGLTKINIKVARYSVYVLPTDQEILSVKYVEPLEGDAEIVMMFVNGELTIQQTDKIESRFWGYGFNVNRFVAVYIPQTELFTQSALEITADTAGISVRDLSTKNLSCWNAAGRVNVTNCNADEATLESNTGSIVIDKLTANSLKANAGAGSVNIDELKANDVSARTSAGSVNIDDVNAQSVRLESKAGSVNADGIVCTDFTANSDAGSVNVSDITATTSVNISTGAGSVKCEAETSSLTIKSGAGSIKFDTNASTINLSSNAGSIKGTIDGFKNEYQIEVRKDMGSSNIENQTVQGATKFLTVDVDMGSIKIDFDND